MTAKKSEQALVALGDATFEIALSPEAVKAMQAIKGRKVPPDKVKTRPGKGGKTFSYMAHTYATETLLDGFGDRFSHEVLETGIDPAPPKGGGPSAWARVRLQVHIPYLQPDGHIQFFTNTITEIGNFDSGGGAMSLAAMRSSAASRGLARCMMRRFGLGLEFYQNDKQLDGKGAWALLWNHVQSQLRPSKEHNRLVANKLGDRLRDADITVDNLVDRFQEAYAITDAFVNDMKGVEIEVPDFEEATSEMSLAKALDTRIGRKGKELGPDNTFRDATKLADGEEKTRTLCEYLVKPSSHSVLSLDVEILMHAAGYLLEHWDEIEFPPPWEEDEQEQEPEPKKEKPAPPEPKEKPVDEVLLGSELDLF